MLAQEAPSSQPDPGSSEPKSEIARAALEMTSHLEELERLKQEQKAIEQSIADAQPMLKEASVSGDTAEKTKATDIIRTAEGALFSVAQKIASIQELYNKAAESYRIENEKATLSNESELTGTQKSPLDEAIQIKSQAKRSEKEAELAEKKSITIQKQLEIFSEQQKRVLRDIQKIDDQLKDKTLLREQRQDLMQSRQELLAKQQELEAAMVNRRQKLVAAKVDQRIKLDKATEEAVKYRQWQENVLRSLVFMAAVVILLMIVRKVVSNRVKDPQRRYYLNRSLSILLVFVVLIGLLVIFVRDFAYLVTGLGVAMAGLAIALQELIASFFAWFVIQGAKG